MKRIIMRLAALMVATNITSAVHAQELPTCPPFVQEGKVWEVSKYHRRIYSDEWGGLQYTPAEQTLCTYTMRGDTLVGGNVMKRLYRTDKFFYGDEEDHYFAAVREEDYRVFIVYDGLEEECCLYDFRPEDECEDMVFAGLCNRNVETYPQMIDLTVGRDEYADEDTLVINGYQTRRFFALTNGLFHNHPLGARSLSDESLMLEGYGNVHTDPFDVSVWADASEIYSRYAVIDSEQYQAGNYEEAPACAFCVTREVEHVYVNGVRIASSWDFSGKATAVEFVWENNEYPVLSDLQGRRLDHEPEHGLYIKDGRKYLKK